MSPDNCLIPFEILTGGNLYSSHHRTPLQLEGFMKSIFYTLTAIVFGGTLIIVGCINTPFIRNNNLSDSTTEIEAAEIHRAPAANLDAQEVQLRKSLDQTGVDVTRKGESIHLNIPGNLTFSSGSYNIKSGFHEVLNSLVFVLKEYKETRINICGHTDSVGKADDNQALSKRRAQSVAKYLAANGVNTERIWVDGLGETQPIASNKTKVGRAKNRRVEIAISPLR
jgi:outer membrane protein OmpA-like peptidoglycan-associated protein